VGEKEKQLESFSYSKLSTYIQCPMSYKLKYIDKHYAFTKSLALEIGTLVHYINENIANLLINDKPVDYDFWKKEIFELDKPNTAKGYKSNEVKGINLLEEEYTRQYLTAGNKSGLTYSDKVDAYISRLKKLEIMHKESDWEILATEVPFKFVLLGKYEFKGSIDRVDINKKTGDIRIIDYKTNDKPFEKKDLTTPLQFVIYAIACVELYKKMPVEFIYDLTFLDMEQEGGTKGFIDRGTKKINSTLANIEQGDFTPNPSPLCYWCDFSATNPNATEKTKRLCPYYSLWTRENPTFKVNKVYDKREEEITNKLETNKNKIENKTISRHVTAKDINLDEEDF